MLNAQPQTFANNLHRALSPFLVPLHAAGLKWVLGCGILALIALLAGWVLGGPLLMLAACFYFTFRNPLRLVLPTAGQILVPADGIVMRMDTAVMPRADVDDVMALAMDAQRIVISTRLPDVHILRAPVSGVITSIAHRMGNWGSNVFDSEAADNEQLTLIFAMPDGHRACLTVTAGGLPQRIEMNVRQEIPVTAGQPIGIAAFGAEVSLYLPANVTTAVKPGQRMVAGETVVATDHQTVSTS